MHLIPLPAFDDNYIWLLHDHTHALVVDPGDADVVTAALTRLQLKLSAILITHHHADHTGGVATLRHLTGAQVYGPGFETMPEPLLRVNEGDSCSALDLFFDVLDVPGHTSGHIAYFCPSVFVSLPGAKGLTPQPLLQPLLFCGDTLFSGGCGRLFEGTPAQMLASLDRLSALPNNTLVCCAHEYTLSNLAFARAAEPNNTSLANYETHCKTLRLKQQPTLPSNIGLERQINPFLRSREPEIRQSLNKHLQTPNLTTQLSVSDAQVFAQLRDWKNNFKAA